MIEIIAGLYPFFMWGISISFVIMAFVVWYSIHIEMKQKRQFDEKYRQTRNKGEK